MEINYLSTKAKISKISVTVKIESPLVALDGKGAFETVIEKFVIALKSTGEVVYSSIISLS